MIWVLAGIMAACLMLAWWLNRKPIPAYDPGASWDKPAEAKPYVELPEILPATTKPFTPRAHVPGTNRYGTSAKPPRHPSTNISRPAAPYVSHDDGGMNLLTTALIIGAMDSGGHSGGGNESGSSGGNDSGSSGGSDSGSSGGGHSSCGGGSSCSGGSSCGGGGGGD